jgi:hypothetical protein
MEGKHHLLEGAGVGIPQEVVDKPRILAVTLGSLPVRNSGRLNHPLVPAQIIHKAHKALVEYRKFLV